jgi:hypothetical protein
VQRASCRMIGRGISENQNDRRALPEPGDRQR